MESRPAQRAVMLLVEQPLGPPILANRAVVHIKIQGPGGCSLAFTPWRLLQSEILLGSRRWRLESQQLHEQIVQRPILSCIESNP